MKHMVFILYTAVIFILGCNPKPPSNTPEYLAKHGVVNGQPNTVSVGGVKVSIPAKYRVNVETRGKIILNQADIVKVYFKFPELVVPDRRSDYIGNYEVRVSLRHMGVVKQDGMNLFTYKHLNRSWDSIEYLKDLDLTRFQSGNGGGWGYISFQSNENLLSVPYDRPLIFRCAGRSPHLTCKAAIQYLNGVHAWIYLPSTLIPAWKTVFEQINTELKIFMGSNK